MQFYSDEQFQTLANPRTLVVGSRFYFEIAWEETFPTAFPVEYYITTCTVKSSDDVSNFDIIKNGCVSGLVQARRHSHTYSDEKVRASFKSFSFTSVTGSFDLGIVCEIGFCLVADRIAGQCGYDSINCPTGYDDAPWLEP